ncbi:sensor histidine kinase [Arthrobacter sp. VKM Ac-2550]|uniref:sensor histidine kinase n=1 Tax=Crystallibacter permensis TaxID=1938888 RepID=UPI0022268E9F|nr:HAMP domain-containing sensor histidine kinase [Arthrobacter sp. VKM Ac-2550]MCW2134466.1 Signal transduction histidine kinase [Arthrobacter sp. VKM Ac-2550]
MFRRLDGLSVRTRVLAAVLALSALGLAVAGGVLFGLQRGQINQRIDDSLRRSVEEFDTLADIGIDPETGQEFTRGSQLVRTVMARTAPAENEGMVGIVDGQVALTANNSVELRLENDHELIDKVVAQPETERIILTSIKTGQTTYRAVTVPVQLSSDPTHSIFLLAFDYDAELEELGDNFRTYTLISLAALVLISGVGWLVAGRLLAPVRLVRETAQKITETDLSRRIPVSGNDDLSELSQTFNEMLDRLQGSMTAQRQLLDDVGHELRTPITIVQGHLELQDSYDPEDVDSVRAIALDELDRMRLLVDDLVTLAGAERPEFVKPRPLEVGQLTDDVLDKARTLGDRRWVVDSRAEHMWSLDPKRMTQAWLQLAANAVKFSPIGSTIGVGSRAVPGELRLWIRDEGAGIAPEDQGRIFARFARGANGTRAEGSGLGLTIVNAIAHAHGGRVELASAPGHGSTFTIVIQERQPEQEDPV